MQKFFYEKNSFYLNGEEITIRSGAIHYFRLPKEYWRDRLLKLKECGFNCVETYVAWNLHEPEEGEFHFEDGLDLGAFIDMAQDMGLLVIVRPGPFICAEWESGGFPYWLHRYPNLKIRSCEPTYLEKAKKYLLKVFEIVKPRLIENGGNIVMLQVENEFGSYGKGEEYLQTLVAWHKQYLPECVLFTSDGAWKPFLLNGSIDGILACGNYGSDVDGNMATLKELFPNQPYCCAEFWCGWFDHWGDIHHMRDAGEIAACVESFLKGKYSFNFYMFFGGTNFGFMNGANLISGAEYPNNGEYQPTVTSYDYGALLTEAGDRTPAYYKTRELIEKYVGDVPPLTAKESEKRAYGKVIFQGYASLMDNLDTIGKIYYSRQPLSMEACEQAYGYLYYEAEIVEEGSLVFDVYRDRIIITRDNKKVDTYMRYGDKKAITPVFAKGSKVGILLENMGRINYGVHMFDSKRIELGIDGAKTGEWKNVSLPMTDLSTLRFTNIPAKLNENAGFYKGTFAVDEPCDTFLRLDGFSKGFAMINGFNLGRYWTEAGPTKTLYVPATILKKGENQLIVFDSDGANSLDATFVDQPCL